MVAAANSRELFEVFKDDSAFSELGLKDTRVFRDFRSVNSGETEFLASQVGEYAVALAMLSKLFNYGHRLLFAPVLEAEKPARRYQSGVHEFPLLTIMKRERGTNNGPSSLRSRGQSS